MSLAERISRGINFGAVPRALRTARATSDAHGGSSAVAANAPQPELDERSMRNAAKRARAERRAQQREAKRAAKRAPAHATHGTEEGSSEHSGSSGALRLFESSARGSKRAQRKRKARETEVMESDNGDDEEEEEEESGESSGSGSGNGTSSSSSGGGGSEGNDGGSDVESDSSASSSSSSTSSASSSELTEDRDAATRRAWKLRVWCGAGAPPPPPLLHTYAASDGAELAALAREQCAESASSARAAERMARALCAYLAERGIAKPTPVQAQALPIALRARRDLLAFAPTGSGKTYAFLLPLMIRAAAAAAAAAAAGDDVAGGAQPRAVILCPTNELCAQIYKEALRAADAAARHGAARLSVAYIRKRFTKAVGGADGERRLRGELGAHVLVATPARLVLAERRGAVSLQRVQDLVFDEADRLFDEKSHVFIEAVDESIQLCRAKQRASSTGSSEAPPLPELWIGLYSATCLPEVEELARSALLAPVKLLHGARANVSLANIDQKLVYCGTEEGKLLALLDLFATGLATPAMLFVQSKDRAEQLYVRLRAMAAAAAGGARNAPSERSNAAAPASAGALAHIPIGRIHAALSARERERTVSEFRAGRVWLLISTELMARGMDFRALQLVINFDLPQSVISYVHRVGRTGRAGRRGTALTFYTDEDTTQLRDMATVIAESGCDVPPWMLAVRSASAKAKAKLERRPVQREDLLSEGERAAAAKASAEHAAGALAAKASKAKANKKTNKKKVVEKKKRRTQ